MLLYPSWFVFSALFLGVPVKFFFFTFVTVLSSTYHSQCLFSTLYSLIYFYFIFILTLLLFINNCNTIQISRIFQDRWEYQSGVVNRMIEELLDHEMKYLTIIMEWLVGKQLVDMRGHDLKSMRIIEWLLVAYSCTKHLVINQQMNDPTNQLSPCVRVDTYFSTKISITVDASFSLEREPMENPDWSRKSYLRDYFKIMRRCFLYFLRLII